MKYLLAFLVGLLGIAAIVLGGADDAPGAQLIGVALLAGAVTMCLRAGRARATR